MNNLPDKKINFIEKYSVKNSLIEFKKIDSALLAFESNGETLAEIKKSGSEKICLALLKIWIVSLNDFLNIARKMSPQQIDEICYYIYQDYHYLKMSDIYLVITRAKKGYYGKFYESLDGTKIMDIFSQYANERSESIYSRNLQIDDRRKYKHERTLLQNKINKLK